VSEVISIFENDLHFEFLTPTFTELRSATMGPKEK
jgi:hypothetical protein